MPEMTKILEADSWDFLWKKKEAQVEERLGCSTFEDGLDSVLKDLRETMIRKQKDYGPKNITECGTIGVVVRMNDKLARLKNIFGITSGSFKQREATNESVEDSFIDVANYGIIALMLKRNVFELPLAEDVKQPALPLDRGAA